MTQHALVVATGTLAFDVVRWLTSIGYHARVVSDFAEAKHEVDTRPPDLLVTQLKLGAFNGLHLVARARGRGVAAPAIVIGEPDRMLVSEARQLDACYEATPLDAGRFTRLALDLAQADSIAIG